MGMVCALAAAVCFGAASVFQAAGTRAVGAGTGSGVDAALLVRALRHRRYVAGLVLDAGGFVLEILALRSVALYAVSAALAASLAVTAVVAAMLLGIRLVTAERRAVAAVCAGLAMVGVTSGTAGGHGGSSLFRWSLLAVAVVTLLAGVPAGRLPGRFRGTVLGLGAGAGFGIVEVAVRLIDSFRPVAFFGNPALYALLVGGAAGFLLLTSAFQSGSVTAATAAMVLGETIGPALAGVVWLGDRTRPGLSWLAVAGFVIAIGGALALARFGEAPAPAADKAAEPLKDAGASVAEGTHAGAHGQGHADR